MIRSDWVRFSSGQINTVPSCNFFLFATNSVGTTYGNEETFETNDPSITVTSPNGGEDWEVGSSHNITWTSAGINNVIIEYSTDNGAEWIPIDTVSAIGGRFNWTVPDTLSDSCLVQISGNDSPGDPSDVSDGVFSITNDQ